MLALLKNIATLEYIDELLDEVIILNNKSTESYQEVIAYINQNPNFPFKYYETTHNMGVSKGRNFAIQRSKAEILVLVDDDAEFKDKDVLKRIENSVVDEKKTGVIAMKVLYFSTGTMQKNAFPHKSYRKKQHLKEFQTYYFAGCGNIILRSVFDEAGGFPEDFFYGMEEYDFSYRIIDCGYTIKYASNIVLLHKESPEGRQPKSEKLKSMWVNKTKVSWRYLPIYCYFSTAFLWAFYFLLKSKFDFKLLGKGLIEIINIPFNEKRRKIHPTGIAYLRKVDARLYY